MKETGNLPFEQAAKVRLAKELLPPPPSPPRARLYRSLVPFLPSHSLLKPRKYSQCNLSYLDQVFDFPL